MLYLQHEWSFDRFQEKGEDIYRLSVHVKWEGREGEDLRFLPTVGPALKQDYPQVASFLRIRGPRSEYFLHDNQAVKLQEILHVDSSFFDMLSFKMLAGDPKTALRAPHSMILTRSLARQIFGNDDVIGKTLEAEAGDIYTITGVAEDPPSNSSIQFESLISFSTLYTDPHMHMGWNGGNQYITYIRLVDNTDALKFQADLPKFIDKYLSFQSSIQYTLILQPFKNIHLFFDPGEIFRQIVIFGTIALLILVVAGFNFINLSLAQSVKRAKEIGVRKAVGADRKHLIFQFLAESIISSLAATGLAVLITEMVFPVYSRMIEQEIQSLSLLNPIHCAGLLLIALIVGLAAGSLPAFHLASLMPVKIMKNEHLSGYKKSRSRNVLLVFQFSVSIMLILGTLVMFKQQNFMKNKALGFNKSNILVVNLPTVELRDKNELIKQTVQNIPEVNQATLCSSIPHRGFPANGYRPEGFEKAQLFNVVYADENFLNTFELKVTQGRNFQRGMATDKNAYLINETLAKTLDWDDPIGKTINRNGDHPVIGVVNDFHFATIHRKIDPMILCRTPEFGGFYFLAMRVSNQNLSATISRIKNELTQIVPTAPFEYWFLDEAFDTLYRYEERINRLFLIFSGLAIFIAILGLYSLVTIATEYRTKEIGIRKVLGSSISGITQVISKEYLIPVLLSNLIAWPLAWYGIHKWLQNFAYRIDLTIWPFLIAGVLVLLISGLTVSWQAMRAASANPIESLRYE